LHIWQNLAKSGQFFFHFDFLGALWGQNIVKSPDGRNGALKFSLLTTMGQDPAQYGMRIKMNII
jgi:hypothetical protein